VLEDPPLATLGVHIRERPFYALFAGTHALLGRGHTIDSLARELAEIRMPGPNGDGEVRLGDVRDATLLRFGARCLLRMDPEVYTPIVEGRWMDGYDEERILRGVRCPTLLLRGDPACGGMLAKSDADRVTALMPHCTMIELRGVGHLIHWTQPETTLRLLTGFLESL
jgi:pimeloyl-ACP methyl ester carboxylesterase